MNQRLTHILVGIVTVALIAATLAFGFVVTSFSRSGSEASLTRQAIPPIVHPVSGSMVACARCHEPGDDGTPANHLHYGAASCMTCHGVAPAAARNAGNAAGDGDPAPVPHPVTARYDDCAGCHAIGGNLGMPADHEGLTNGDCADCHARPDA